MPIITVPAASPADVLFNRLIKAPSKAVSPAFCITIPRVKETAKYPIPIGKPPLSPDIK